MAGRGLTLAGQHGQSSVAASTLIRMDKPPSLASVSPLPRRSATPTPDYRRMVEAVEDYAIFMLDAHGVILSWNRGAQRLKGYEADEIIGRHFSVFYPPELLARRWPEHELAVAVQVGKYEEEGWRLRKDGTRFWASVTMTRIDGDRGQVLGFVKVTRDLTERQRQEEEVRASEQRFRLLVDSVKDYAIFMLDPSGHVVSWNAGARANTGYEAAEIIGQHFSVFYPDEVRATGFPERELKEARTVGRFEDEGWRLRKDGTRFWANVVISAIFDAGGVLKGFAKVTRDLTEKRRVAALETEGRRLQEFLALLGHELRNPLAPIATAAEILGRGQADATVARMAGIIGRQTRQLTRLVDDLLDAARIANGKIQLERRPVEIATVVEEALEAFQARIAAREQTLSVDLAPGLWTVGDRARLIQVVSNLVANAAKYTQPRGHIRVETGSDESGARVWIRVRDNGPGIAPEQLPRMFEMFEQGQQGSERAPGGLGLGLALVRQLVQMHGGEVEARSTGVAGEGTEFVVALAALEAVDEGGAEGAAAAIAAPLVLVVDDLPDSAETLGLLIETMGYAVARAHDGVEALDSIRRLRPQLVVLDLGLPGLSGWAVADQAHLAMREPPLFIAVSGYALPTHRAATLERGFAAHLAKPVDVELLERTLRRLAPTGSAAPRPGAGQGP